MINLEPINYSEPKNLALVEDYLAKSGEPGRFCGFHCLDEFYTHKDNGITDWTGFPGVGKSYFALEVLFNLSQLYGKRHMLYVPDIGNYKEVIEKLLKMYIGKDFNPKYHNQLSVQEIYKHIPWLQHHFIILKRKDIKKTVSAIEFWEYVCEFKDEAGGVDTGFIDSWKNMYRDMTGFAREDQYLDYALSYRNELSEHYNKHFHTIAHATKTEIEEGIKGAKKKRRIPDANDIKGGGSWFANGKNIITVDFPDKMSNAVDLHISKTKPEGVGKVGSIIGYLFLDRYKGRYYEIFNGKHRYGNEPKEVKNLDLYPVHNSIQRIDETEPPF